MTCKWFNWGAYYGGYCSTMHMCLHPDNAKGVCPYVWMRDCPHANKEGEQRSL